MKPICFGTIAVLCMLGAASAVRYIDNAARYTREELEIMGKKPNFASNLTDWKIHVTDNIVWKDCGSKAATIKSVTVDSSDCSTKGCTLHKGKNYTVMVNFMMTETTNEANAKAWGILDGVAVPYPLPNPDACKGNNGITCPLEENKKMTYKATLPVLKEFPSVKVIVKWNLSDSKSNVIWCFETPISVV